MGYLVMTAPAGQPMDLFEAMVGDLERRGWRTALSAFGLIALVRGEISPEVHVLKDGYKTEGVLVGRVFERAPDAAGQARRADLSHLTKSDPVEACRALCRAAFGSYVAVLAPKRGQPTILRSPDGMVDAFAWRREDVVLVGDELPEGLAQPTDLAIDWRGVGEILAEPVRAATAPPLRGVMALDPGLCRHGQGLGQQERLWSPAEVVRAAPRVTPSARALRAAVDLAIAAELDGAGRVLCEISGGLDSAIVATSLAAVGHPPDLAVNFWRDQAEADERLYAQAAAERARAPLQTIRRDLLKLDAGAFALSARSVRPNLNAVDPDYDRLLVEAIGAGQADLLVTGHGGDVVFYQLGAAEIAADLLAGAPCQGGRMARLADIARRTRRSIWSLAWETMRGRPGVNSPKRAAEPDGLVRTRAEGPVHPWMADLVGLSRAKRVQIAGLVTSLGVAAPTARAAAARLAHPLLAQPVVELCLQIPIPILSNGEGERTFARRAFAERLPPSIVGRRSKGDITTFFGRSMALSAGFLREHLLDGRLVAEGLLDPARVAAALTPQALVWRDTYGALLVAATLEAWVRHWEGRCAMDAVGAASFAGDPRASARNASARP